MSVIAKPVIPNKYWILTNEEGKIGQVETTDQGVEVKIKGQIHNFKTIPVVKQKTDITFETIKKSQQVKNLREVNGFPTDSVAHNAVYDVQKKLPLYTKQAKSKSWYAAGWYLVKVGSRWVDTFCPKLLTLKRTQYVGPVKTREDLRFK